MVFCFSFFFLCVGAITPLCFCASLCHMVLVCCFVHFFVVLPHGLCGGVGVVGGVFLWVFFLSGFFYILCFCFVVCVLGVCFFVLLVVYFDSCCVWCCFGLVFVCLFWWLLLFLFFCCVLMCMWCVFLWVFVVF